MKLTYPVLAFAFAMAAAVGASVIGLQPANATQAASPVDPKLTAGQMGVLRGLRYVRDPRTGLCFAYAHVGMYGFGLTNVPCEKVEKFIQQ